MPLAGRALGRIAHVVRYEVARTGGIPPPARQRARLALTLTEREAISAGWPAARRPADQPPAAPGPVDRESGGAAARGPAPVSGGRGRRGGVTRGRRAQAVSPGAAPGPA